MRKAQVYFTRILRVLPSILLRLVVLLFSYRNILTTFDSEFNPSRKKVLGKAIALLALPVIFFLLAPRADAATGILKQINFQGKVVNTNGTNVANSSYTFLFCLYTVASPSTPCTAGANNDAVWRESKSLTVTDGVFQTLLGDTTTLPGSVDFNTDNIYLGVNFNSDGQMTPLVRFSAVPYAFNADKIHGLTVTDTTGTFTLTNAKTLSVSNSLTFAGTDSTTITFQGTDTYVGRATTDTLTNKTIGSSGLTFSGATTDITTVSNEDLTLAVNGSGNFVFSTDFDSGITLGTAISTEFPLLVRSGIGNNAALAVDNLNLGDIFTASASGTTRFSITSAGGIKLGTAEGTNGDCLKSGGVGAAATYGSCGGGSQTPWTTDIDADNFSLLDFGPNITARGALTIASTGSNTLTLDSGSNTLTFAATDTTLTASGLATITSAASLAISATTLELGGTGASTVQTNSNDNLTLTPNGTGSLILTSDFNTPVLVGSSSNTGAVLSVRGGFGSNAALMVDNLNSGDLISASASGVTKFTVSNGGNITAGTYNGNTITTGTGVLTLAASKTLTVSNTLTLSGTDGSSLAIGAGGTLGSNAFTSTAYAPLASPTFTGTVTIPTPFTIGATSMTSTGTQLNYLNAATGTTGTTSTNVVFSTSPTLVTPVLGVAAGTSLALGTNPAAAGTLRLPNATYITARNAANSADINMIQIDASNLVSFGANTAAFTLGGAITGNSQSITGVNSLSSTSLTITGSLTANGSTGSGLCLNGGATAAWGSCGGGGGGTDRWQVNNGLLSPGNGTVDFAIGGTSTGSAKFVFGGMNAGTPTATFSGDLVINNKPTTSVADMQKWTKITGTSGTIGGGTGGVASVSASAVFNGSLYVGTHNPNNAEIYRYNGDALGTWTKVSGTAGTVGGGATTAIDIISSLIVYNGYLYAGTFEADKAEIYRYDGASSWTKVSGAAGTILTTTLIDGVSAMAVFGGRLFAGTSEPTKAEVYMYNGGTTWIAVTGTAGTLVATNTVTQDAITSMVVINNQLIVGTKDATDADVVRWNGIVGGSPFFALNLASTTGSYLIDNAAQTGYLEVSAMTVWSGKLVVALRRGASLADILMYQEPPAGVAPINSWTRLNSAAGTITSGGTANIDGVTALAVYNGRLYAGTNEPGAAQIYRYEGEKTWTVVSQNTAGTIAGGGRTAIDSIATLMPYNHNSLFAGTMETGAAEGYAYVSSIDQSYAIKFHAGTSQGGGEQNGLTNMASIFFVASLSANVNNKVGNTGSFVFTHGITTNNGSYDVAEDYPTRDDALEPGDVVSIDPHERGFVKKSEGDYDYTAIGVYSEDPALRLSQDFNEINGGHVIPIALAGRVPVKVSTENGKIKSGDPLTPSSIPGVAMKAKKSGLIIGQAMEEYSGEGVGKVIAYIKSASYNGSIAENFTNIDVNSKNFGNDVLTALNSQDTGLLGSDIVTDRLIANIEIVSQKITVDTLFAKKIKTDQIDLSADAWQQALQAGGLSVITDRIDFLSSQIATLSSALTDKTEGHDRRAGNTAEEIKSASASATKPPNDSSLTLINSDRFSTVSGNLRVKNNGLFEGILSVIDTFTTNNFIVNGLSTLFGDVIFKAKVAFEGPVTFSGDTGGVAIISKDEKRVEVVFDKEFDEYPIINASISFNEEKNDDGSPKETSELEQEFFAQGYSYIIVNKSKKGFVIAINKKAEEDIAFTWTALLVKDAKTIQSRAPN